MLKTAVELFKFLWWIERSEEQHLSEIEIICNIINVFIITFDQFKASLLNKSINLYNNNNNYTDYKLLNGIVYNVTKAFYFTLMLIFGSFYSSKNPKKIYSTVLNIDDDNKCLLNSKSAY